MINTTTTFYELRIYDRKRGYELTDLKPKDAAEVMQRWSDCVEHYGVGLYRSQEECHLWPIMSYFKSRRLYMEIKTYNKPPKPVPTREELRKEDNPPLTPYGERDFVTFFQDLFTWHWLLLIFTGSCLYVSWELTLGDTQGVWSSFTVFVFVPCFFGFMFSCAWVMVRIFYVVGGYFFQPLYKLWWKYRKYQIRKRINKKND